MIAIPRALAMGRALWLRGRHDQSVIDWSRPST